MTSYRTDQVGEQVREEIMSIIRRDLKDPRIGFVSITAVRMSPDLRQARVRVSVLGDPDEKKASIAGLVSARGPHPPRARPAPAEPQVLTRASIRARPVDRVQRAHQRAPEGGAACSTRRRRHGRGGPAIATAASRDQAAVRRDQGADRRQPGGPDLRPQGRRRRHARLQPGVRGGAPDRGQARMGPDPAAPAGHVRVPARLRRGQGRAPERR